jgi:F-type H+-transporting ATPase subunit epsilon
MQLKILLPFKEFVVCDAVVRISAPTRAGSFGILPQRLDCVAALAPGILSYATQTTAELYVAIDEGVMVKAGAEVFVCVRRAIGGTDLGNLRKAVEQQFLKLDEREKSVRSALAQLEGGLIRRFVEFQHG